MDKKLVNLKSLSKRCKVCKYKKDSLLYDICKDCGECWENGKDLFANKRKKVEKK